MIISAYFNPSIVETSSTVGSDLTEIDKRTIYKNITEKLSRQQKRFNQRKGLKNGFHRLFSPQNAVATNEVCLALSPAKIPVKIGHASAFYAGLTAIGDPGSGVTVVDADVLKIAKIPINSRDNPKLKLKVANSTELETIGTAIFDVSVGPQITKVRAFVVKSLPQRLILGTPWLTDSKAIMDFDNMGIYFNNRKKGFIPINVTNEHSVTNNSDTRRIHLIGYGRPGNRIEEFCDLIIRSYDKIQ